MILLYNALQVGRLLIKNLSRD